MAEIEHFVDPLDKTHHKFDLIKGDVRFEPLSALTAADNGLSDIKKIVSQAKDYLHDNGLLIIEHGNTQGEAIRDVFIQNGYRNTSTIKDLSENDRITVGYFKLMG